jgi:hypothetical protein
MKITNIEFFSEVEDIFDDNIDVGVKLEDGSDYVVVVATQKNLLTSMNNENSDFVSPGEPMIIVRKITKEVVQKAIEAYIEEEDGAYYLKLYGTTVDLETLNRVRERQSADDDWMDELLEKDGALDIENSDPFN